MSSQSLPFRGLCVSKQQVSLLSRHDRVPSVPTTGDLRGINFTLEVSFHFQRDLCVLAPLVVRVDLVVPVHSTDFAVWDYSKLVDFVV